MVKNNDSFKSFTSFTDKLKTFREFLLNHDSSDHFLPILDGALSELQQKHVKLTVCGPTSSGKSSLINALIGDNLLPLDVRPETSLLTEIQYGQNIKLETINLNRGTINSYDIIDLNTVRHKISQLYEEYMHLNSTNNKDVSLIKISYPSIFLKEGLVLLDTPGFGSMVESHDEIAIKAINESQGFLLVTSTNPPFSKTDKAIYDECIKNSNWINIFVNKIDIASFDDHEIFKLVKQVSVETGIDRDRIKCVSANYALEGYLQKDVDLINKSRIDDCVEHIKGSLALNDPRKIRYHYIKEKLSDCLTQRLKTLIEIKTKGISAYIKKNKGFDFSKAKQERLINNLQGNKNTNIKNIGNGFNKYKRRIKKHNERFVNSIEFSEDTDKIQKDAEKVCTSIKNELDQFHTSCQNIIKSQIEESNKLYCDYVAKEMRITNIDVDYSDFIIGGALVSSFGGALISGALMSTPTLFGSPLLAAAVGFSTGSVFSIGAALATGGILVPIFVVGGFYFVKNQKLKVLKRELTTKLDEVIESAISGGEEKDVLSLKSIRSSAIDTLNKLSDQTIEKINKQIAALKKKNVELKKSFEIDSKRADGLIKEIDEILSSAA